MATALGPGRCTPWDFVMRVRHLHGPRRGQVARQGKPQNGTTSRHMWLLPLLPHAHFRLSSYEAGVATTAADGVGHDPRQAEHPSAQNRSSPG